MPWTIVRRGLASESGMAVLMSRVALMSLGCAVLLGTSSSARAQQNHSEAAIASDIASGHASFDIPAQPLATALRAYSEATGLAVLVDDSLTKGRKSPGVQGRLAASEALQSLLIGTGLEARYASPSSFTLMRRAGAETTPNREDDQDAAESPADTFYARALQTTLERALCQSEQTRPGRYRLAMQLWLDESGRVQRTQLLGSTGTEARDAEIVAAIDSLAFGPAPASLKQPLTVLLQQSKPSTMFDCGPYRASPH